MPHDTMTATSSSVFDSPDWPKSKSLSSLAINGIINDEDIFHSNKDKYPWLALDLGVGFLYKVPIC